MTWDFLERKKNLRGAIVDESVIEYWNMIGRSLEWGQLCWVPARREEISTACRKRTVIDTKNTFENQAFSQTIADELTANKLKPEIQTRVHSHT